MYAQVTHVYLFPSHIYNKSTQANLRFQTHTHKCNYLVNK